MVKLPYSCLSNFFSLLIFQQKYYLKWDKCQMRSKSLLTPFFSSHSICEYISIDILSIIYQFRFVSIYGLAYVENVQHISICFTVQALFTKSRIFFLSLFDTPFILFFIFPRDDLMFLKDSISIFAKEVNFSW